MSTTTKQENKKIIQKKNIPIIAPEITFSKRKVVSQTPFVTGYVHLKEGVTPKKVDSQTRHHETLKVVETHMLEAGGPILRLRSRSSPTPRYNAKLPLRAAARKVIAILLSPSISSAMEEMMIQIQRSQSATSLKIRSLSTHIFPYPLPKGLNVKLP